MLDARGNLVFSTVKTAPSPALSGLSLEVQTADQAIFDAVLSRGDCQAVVHPANVHPNVLNAEIVRITASALGVLTIVRAQESSSAISIAIGYIIAIVPTKKMYDDIEAQTPPGIIHPYAGRLAPLTFLLCDGSAVSRTTYIDLFAAIVPNLGAFTVTVASPGVFTLNSHGLLVDDAVYLNTTGALPTGLAANTIYYVISAGLTANNFRLSATRGGAAINTSGTQSGTHSLFYCPFGLGDGSTTFNVPDLRQRVPVGRNTATFNYLGKNGGEETHVLTTAELATHNHGDDAGATSGIGKNNFGGSTFGPNQLGTWQQSGGSTANTGSDAAHNNLQPYLVLNYIIKT